MMREQRRVEDLGTGASTDSRFASEEPLQLQEHKHRRTPSIYFHPPKSSTITQYRSRLAEMPDGKVMHWSRITQYAGIQIQGL